MIRWLLLALLLVPQAQAAEVTVLSAGAMNAVASAVKPVFERETGNSVVLSNDTVGGLVRRIQDGAPFDVVLMSPAGLKQLGDRIAADSVVTLARVGVGVGIRSGSPQPDISSVEAFKAALLASRGVAYIDPASGGSSGIYLAKLFQTLGIAQSLAGKTVLVNGGLAAKAVQDGQADIVLQQISEIVGVPGITLLGPLPEPIQMMTTYSGALSAAARSDAARAFLAAMTGPQARAVIASKGMDAP